MSCANSNVIGKSRVPHIMTEFLYRCPTLVSRCRHGPMIHLWLMIQRRINQ